jgi:DNA-directed RNA polymerase specialized sigma24 family protein
LSDLDVYLGAIQAGDAEAFAHWLAGAELPLRRSLRRFAPFVDTEAVMQEALLRVWQVAVRCKPDGRPDSLLRLAVRIARNLAVSGIRRAGARPPEVGGADNPGPIDPTPAPDPILRARIRDCLEKLPSRPKTCLLARLESEGGRSDRALAAVLGMRLNTFLQNITRARRLLADCLHRSGIEVPA